MFENRREAGTLLSEGLSRYADAEDSIVLALPRGGVVTGHEIAMRLHLPLDVIIVRKIGFPGQPEFGIGAVAETGAVFLDEETISTYGITDTYIKEEISRQQGEISRRIAIYRNGGRIPLVTGMTVLLVDDGIATGATMRVAIMALAKEEIRKLVVALPVGPPGIAAEFEKIADEFICLETPEFFEAVGRHYVDFWQVTDEQVRELLLEARKVRPVIGLRNK